MRIAHTTIIYFLSKSIAAVIGFLATIYFARVLGEVVLGQYALVLAVMTWLSIIGRVGLGKAVKKRVSEKNESNKYVIAGLILVILLFLFTSTISYVFREDINNYVGANIFYFVIILLAVELFAALFAVSLQGYHKVHIYSLFHLLRSITKRCFQIGLVFIGFGLSGMLIGYVTGGLVMIAGGLYYIKLQPTIPSPRHYRSLFDFAKYSWIGNIRAKAIGTVDITVLGFFVSSGLVGVYSVAWTIAQFLDTFGKAVSQTLFPEISRESTSNSDSKVTSLTELSLTYSGLLIIPGIFGGAVISDRIMLIYGESFVRGEYVLTIFFIVFLFYTYNKQFLSVLNAVDRPGLAFRCNLVLVVSNLTLNILFVYLYGWIGAAFATMLSTLIGCIISFEYARSEINFSIPFKQISYQWIAGVGMGLSVYLLRRFGERHWIASYNELFVTVLVSSGAILYFVLLLTFSNQLRKTVSKNILP